MSLPFATEQQVAVCAVRRACALTSSVFQKLVTNESEVKGDKSPVTIGDYAAQAVIASILSKAFPADPIVGEEDASSLRAATLDSPANHLKSRIISLANEALTSPLSLGEQREWGLGPEDGLKTEAEILDAIDRGNYEGGRTGRMWTIDPIDGTKGFLRGGQYAVCLSLIVDGHVKVGVIGCPNLPVSATEDGSGSGEKGAIFVAVEGQGTHQLRMSGANPDPVTIPPFPSESLESLAFLESVEAAHSSHSLSSTIATSLGIKADPVRMDSQAKYGCLARGQGGAYLRLPTGVGYVEKIWDHAPGSLIVQEAGGIVTDSRGLPLDFGLGRTLGENFGVVAAGKDVHGRVLAAVQQAMKAEEQRKFDSKARV